MWGAMTDLPESIANIPYIGKYMKAEIWTLILISFAVWAWIDPSLVGILFVGIALLGLPVGLSLACFLYTGEGGSRLYGLKRLVDVYPSITKPEGHVRFNQKPYFSEKIRVALQKSNLLLINCVINCKLTSFIRVLQWISVITAHQKMRVCMYFTK